MGTVREFTEEDYLPCDPFLEYYAELYLKLPFFISGKKKVPFGQFYKVKE